MATELTRAMTRALAARQREERASPPLRVRRLPKAPQARLPMAWLRANTLAREAATRGSIPLWMKWGTWCRLTPPWNIKVVAVNPMMSHRAGVLRAWERVKLTSAT